MPQPTSSATANFSDSMASLLLDLVRLVAALLVCVGHWRYLFFVDYPQLPAHRAVFLLPYILCTLGHQAVILFFVMSGYLIGGHVLRGVRSGSWSWSRYAIQRLTRLWIVLLPALVLGGVLDLCALHFHVAPALYLGQVENHLVYDVRSHLTWTALFGNMFFLQTVRSPVFGSNSPLWSLANEFWYYVVFPLGFLAWHGGSRQGVRVLQGVVAVALLWAVGRPVSGQFSVWLFGAVLAFLPPHQTSAKLRWAGSLVYWVIFIGITRSHVLGPLASDQALGVCTAVYLYLLLGASATAPVGGLSRTVRVGAAFSYSLYVLHMPFLMMAAGLLAGERRWLPDPRHLALGFLSLVAVIAYAYGVAWVTEFRTGPVRQFLERRLLGRAASDRSLERAAV